MRQHRKQIKRKHRKAEAARQRRVHPAVRRGVSALAASAAIASGTTAYATPVRFDNPSGIGHYSWLDASGEYETLGIQLDAASQPVPVSGGPGPGEFSQQVVSSYGFLVTNSGGFQVGGYADYFVVGVGAGDLVPSGTPWRDTGYSYSSFYASYYGFGSEIPEGFPTYLGVRFNPGDGYHYGWIGVVRNPDGSNAGHLDPFAWGYETEPNMPIPAGAPEPGTLALLAFGAVGICARRRRSAWDR